LSPRCITLKLALPLIFAVGCTTQIDASKGAPPSNAGSNGVAAGGAGSNASAGAGSSVVGVDRPPPSPESCAKSEESVRTPLRRLTRTEYTNSVRDLLDVDVSATADLPADEVTNGFDNNAAVLTVSSLHAEKYVLVSETLAKLAVQKLSTLTAGCDTTAKGEDACALAFAKSFGRRAFRRPTTAEDERQLLAAYAAGHTGGSYAEGVEVMLRAALQSPNFLYRLELTPATDAGAKRIPLSQFELASRLSYLAWASGPDDALLDAAAKGELATKEQVAAKVRELLSMPKARAAIAGFFEQWAGTRRLAITTKNSAQFPGFSTQLRDAMAKELPAFINDVLWNGDRQLSTLLTAPVAFISGPLAQVYGISAPAGAGDGSPVKVTLPANQQRAGILTQAGFLSVQGHPDQTSPVLRGKFVRAMLLCQPPPPPPADVDISLPTVDEGATARLRFGAHESAGASCAGCHRLMDPIGLAFEHFDAIGQYRERDNGQALDVSGEVLGAADASLSGAFNGPAELAAKLASSEQVRACVATQWFRFASGRSEANGDACSLATMQRAFNAASGDIIDLIVATTQTDAFWYRPLVTQ
jgi:uncharacterized protein DUF1592/uncharacterized protein DUF1588/uncharacterized protein DUF1587/uncharacterized protein DUF1595/uncharacterized protein DUF1585